MDEQEILRVLTNEFNLHWESGETPKSRVKDFRRRDFFALLDQLKSEKITSIIGPRRVGKTTIMFQLIDHLIKEIGVNPKRILYVSMDNDYLIKNSEEPLKDIIEVYLKYVLKESPSKLQDKIYVFLDEIQYLSDWQKKMKSWFDYKYSIKFVVSGSSSMLIQKGATYLVGRMHERVILPLEFVDMLNYHSKDREYNEIAMNLRNSLRLAISKKNPDILWKAINDVSYDLVKKEHEIGLTLQNFMIKGGYPELLGIEDYSACSSELKDTILSKSILDIVERYKLRNIGVLRYLFTIIAAKSGGKVTYTGISQNLGVERPTIISHLDYLEDAFLISKSNFYSKSVVKRARKEKKYYVSDTGMRNSIVGMMNESLLKDSAELGIVAETLVFDHTKRLRFFLSERQTAETFYWSDNGNEIDIILDYGGISIPIEVKFRDRIDPTHSKAMFDFMKKYKSPFGIMVTKNHLELKDKILYIPLRLYLMMC
ncbi:MAG: ATP-binding protein [Candidatus Aenigmarchaeota archaeon]|nr:ATP-binding protein [Candidatus Aenigmarchaeota archaeon]